MNSPLKHPATAQPLRYFYSFLLLCIGLLHLQGNSYGQTSTEFWLAPPYITPSHAGQTPVFIRLAAGDAPATVTISIPANPAFNGGTPLVVNLAANASQSINMNAFVGSLMTHPPNTVLNTGLKISSTASITAIYEVSPTNNPDIYALKGLTGLGTEFFVPMQNRWPNGAYAQPAYSSFDIVATEDNTTILILPTSDLDGGQNAFETFTITLNEGQTYSASVTNAAAINNPTGSIIISDKDIAVSIKDDSVRPTGAGCRDLQGDQLVPIEIIGNEYIVIRGGLNTTINEWAYAVATQNNTQISVNGVPQGAPLFAGQTLAIQITTANPRTYITGNKDFYMVHVSGFGCESGIAVLPPLACAGSEQVSFTRSTTESFFLNLLVPAGAEDDFVLNGNAGIINPADFQAVPGTGGAWLGARIQFNTTQIPVNVSNLLVNTQEPFALGLINGGASSGCRYGYFSEFSAPIVVDAGPNQNVCANRITQLGGDISGGATQGVWSSNGTGAFLPDEFALDAIYDPSLADLSAGQVTLTLSSVSNCFPVTDEVVINYNPAPIVDAGAPVAACENNTVVSLSGFVDIATGALWSGGSGTFSPSPAIISPTYTPTAAEVEDGSLWLYLTTTGNGNCFAEVDSVEITWGPAPTADAGTDQTVCANNSAVTLDGAVTGAGGGQWSGGAGLFTPSNQALGAAYNPTALEIANGFVTLTLTTTNNGGCIAVTDQMTILFDPAPIVDAGSDQNICRNNADIQLSGSVTGAGGGVWSGGVGTFIPDANTLNAVYTPTAGELLLGGITLTLTSTGNGDCLPVADQVTFNFTNPPAVSAGADANVCENNTTIALNGSLVGANFGLWSGGLGNFSPNTTTLNANYTPTADEVESGSVTLTLTSLDNGNCNLVTDEVTFTFTPAPTANAGTDQFICENNPAVQLNGAVSVAGGGQWSGGNGSFSPDNTVLGAVYNPTVAEIANGSVTLTLTTTSNGNCSPVNDQVLITFTDAPTANAGADQVLCANNAQVSLNGVVSVASGGQWTGGLGSFSNGANGLVNTYTPTTTEINSGSLTLTLTTTGNGNCAAVSDDVTITFTPAPTVEAGAPISVCANNAQVSLSGNVTISGGGQWSGGAGTFFPNVNALNALYTPTAAEIASGSLNLTLTSTSNGNCNPVDDFVTITFTPAPVANAGADVTVCANNTTVNLNGTVNVATGGIWSGGSGSFNPGNTSLGASYTPSAAEIANGSATLTLTTTGNANCNPVADQMVITISPPPVVDAGIGSELCSNNPLIALNGSVTIATGGTWSGGSGTFTPNASTLNATYLPSQSEINSGSLTLTLTSTGNNNCIAVSDNVTYTFGPSPTAEAGPNQTLCANNAEAQLNGSVGIATGGNWSGGSGAFSPSANALNAFYVPTPEEITAGSVTLTLTTTGNGNCIAVSDDVVITYTPAPTANAGIDRTVCANNPDVVLNGSVSIATGGTWTSGTGTFNPDANTLGATYTPSADEIAAGSVTLTLTTTGNGTCFAVSDNMLITITPAPVVDAGAGGELCSNNAAITLNGLVVGATGGSWSGGNGTFNPNSNTLNAVYTPSQGEINSGALTLTLTSTGNATCLAVSDEVTYTFGPSPTAEAGPNQTLCANNAEAQLNGSVSIATGGTWSGGSGAFSPSVNALNAFYVPTPEEIAAGTVTLTLTTTGNGNCNAVSDNVVITYTPAPTANAGIDRTVCANNPDVVLNGSVSIATGGTWTGGTGTFSPDANTLGATYTPSADEIADGTVTLTLTTTGNGTCFAVSDNMTITITPAPVVDAGTGGELCSNNAAITLNGSVVGATGGSWSGGNGTFNPNSNTLNAVYTPSQGEINGGVLTLTLTSTGNANCLAVTDEVTYTFGPSPTAEAGTNQTLCANNAEAQLNGSVGIATGGTWSGGSGAFSPSANALNAFYVPTPEEITAGSVTLTLTTTGNGNCNAVSDDVVITYTPAPTANAGVDRTVCGNNPAVPLNGAVTVATGGIWSGGNGSFDPSNTSLGAVYTPSAGEIADGNVTLTLTTTGIGNCNVVSDQMNITITPAPIVSAGVGATLCSNNSNITLNGSVVNAGGGVWSGGSGFYTPNANTLNAVYTPSQSEINNGFVTLTLTSTGNGNCLAENDQVTYNFSPAPTSNAGPDQTLCANNNVAQLNGAITIATGGTWSGGAGSFMPNANALNATYTPTAAEIANGSVELILTTTGNGNCTPVTDAVIITYTPAPTANAGVDRTVCANNPGVLLNGAVTVASGGTWSGGTGTFNPDANTLGATYTPSADEIADGTVTLTLTTTGNGTCFAVSDNMTITITPPPTIDAGAGSELCANNPVISLNGTVSIATGGTWTGGNGSYNPDPNTLDATYTPTQGEINGGSITFTLSSTGNGTCLAVTDQVTYTFGPSPTANAGPDQSLCANNAEAVLNGAVTIASGGTWSGGAGAFSPSPNNLSAFYVPTPEEITAGSVTLTLTTTGNGNCNAVSDEIIINYTPAPTINAGPDQTVCANNAQVILAGSTTVATGGTWSGGTGTFFPDANSLGASYLPSAAEIAAGTVTLTLTSTGNANCNPVNDQMTITITPAPMVEAGVGEEVCSNNPAIALNGSVTIASGGTWTGGGGVFSPDANSLNATYTPTQGEINSGSITLTLTSTGNGSCSAVSDAVTYTFGPSPTANAGTDITRCANNNVAQLNGSVTTATGGTWTGGAGSFSPNANTLNATYTPTAAEIADGSVSLTLTTTGNGNCNAVSDEVIINYTPAPIANAGPDRVRCANNPDVELNGSVSIASGGVWSGGSGTFDPSPNVLNPTYTPSASEIAAGTVTLTLTTTGNGNCSAENDQMTITINPEPVVDAGSGAELCANNPTIVLNGSVLNAGGGAWSGGNGTFAPNSNTLNSTYTPSQGEINNGSLTLTLTSTGNANCLAVTDEVTYTFSPAPTTDAGLDQTLCANNNVAQLNGNVTVATGATWSGGAGTFAPNANALNATYTPTATEIANGSVDLILTSTGNEDCNAVTDNVVITYTPAPVVNAGADQAVCANNAQTILAGSVSIATGGTWTGGSGTFFPDANSLGASYTPSAAEIAAGTVTLTLTSAGNGNCFAVSDQVVITINPAPIVNAGNDFNVCSNNNVFDLSGSIQNAGGGQWTGGNGTYDPSSTSLNPTYTPTLAELFGGSITFTLTSTDNGGCVAVSDQVTVTFTPSPTADAGPDQTLCAATANASLTGGITVATGGQWSGGNGSFNPSPFVLNSTYIPTAAEVAAGSVTLTLTTTGNGNCLPVSDDVIITFTPIPTINAGANLFSCANNPNVSLNASFSNAGGMQWSGGTGFYDPNATDPSAIYTPSNADILNGGVTLTATTTGTGACPAASDNVTITISPAPVVNAGTDFSLCANNSLGQLNGTVSFAGGGQWSGGLGVFTPSPNALSATYQASAAEIAAGFVTLTLTSTGNGTCNPVSDQVTITYTPAPLVDAGTDITACANNAAVQLNGSFTVAEGAAWSGGSGSFSPSSTSMNAVYTPSQSELTNGSVTLTLTSFGNGNCLPSSDQVTLTFTPAPVVEAGEDIFACVDALTIPLEGSVSGPTTSGVWSTSGTGTFVPSQFALNGSYIASSQDSLLGGVTLTLTSTSNGLCTPVTDALQIFINPAGTADAGADQTSCANNPNIVLNGIIGGAASTGFWETSGTGIFTPSANVLNPTYLPSEDDIAGGAVSLSFFANSCNQAFDTMVLTITPSPVVDAGSDMTTCAADGEVALSGAVSGVSNTGIWSSSGSGSFSPSPNDLNAIYIYSAQDIANQGVDLTLSATGIGTCLPVSASITVDIFPQGTASAGPDITTCANNAEVDINGILTGADQGLWSTSGTGSFSPNATALNATYIPSAADIGSTSVNLVFTATNSCNPASDFLVLNFTPAPVVDAGPDQEVCGTVIPFQINGSVSVASGGQWSTSGSGTFQNANNLSTFYVASQEDIDNGGAVLTLTSTGNGTCLPVSNALVISITTGILVDAGPDREVCSTLGQTQLFGDVSNGSSTGTWTSSGNGSFSPSADALNAVYNFTPEDIASGSVTLTLTSTNNGICDAVIDSFELTFGNTAFVFAGNATTYCETQELLPLNGQVSGETSSGIWSTDGDGIFLPTETSLSAFYEPGPGDVENGGVTLTLTSTGSELCAEGSADVDISFQPLPTAEAGANVLLCGDLEPIQLLGSVNGATGGVWSSNGSGSFSPDATTLTATYLPSQADSLMGNVQLTLTTTGNALCAAGTDVMNISFSEAVIPEAGPNQEVCEDVETISLNGQLVGTGSVEWSSNGTGSFDPGTAILTTSYIPSEADVAAGSIVIYLAAQPSGSCPGLTDSLTVSFDRLPQIDVATNIPACTTTESVSLSANVAFQDAILWSSTGGGTFSPNANLANVQYTPTAAEVASGTAVLNINAISNGACGTVSTPVNINFVSPAVVNAGPDITSCSTQSESVLNGLVSGNTTTGQWSTSGFGTFEPDNTELTGSYVFGSNDVLLGFATLTLTSTNNGPCAAVSDNLLITINPAPVANAGSDIFACSNTGSISLSGTAQNAVGITWSTSGDGVFLPGDDDLTPEYIIGLNDQITQSVTLTLTLEGLEGCSSTSDALTLNITTPLIADFNFGVACEGAPVAFTDQTEVLSGTITGWQWSFGNGNVASVPNPVVAYAEIGSYNVSLVVQSSIGCSDTVTQVVNVLPAPIANFSVSNNPASIGFDITFENTSLGATSYEWDMGDGFSTFSTPNVVFAYPEEGNFMVSLVATGQGGCLDSTSQIVNIDGRLVLPPRLPNTFTPNADGLNDVYYVRGGPFSEMIFKVYNGWGQEVFSSSNQEQGWDGTKDGEQLPLGVYVYTIKATTILGESYDYSGKINLIR